jgi:hypothetical protein
MRSYGLGLTREIFQVPVIAVFTKYDQFRREIRMKLEDQHLDPGTHLDAEIESIFNLHFLASLTGPPPFIRLESEQFDNERTCTILISSCRNEQAQSAV